MRKTLVKVHDAVQTDQLDAAWVRRYNELRSLRNRIIHTVSKDISLAVRDVLNAHLAMYTGLFPDTPWLVVREQMVLLSPHAAFARDHMNARAVVWRELAFVIDVLEPAMVRRYFGIDKKGLGYKCPACLNQADADTQFLGHLARRQIEDSERTIVFCPVCSEKSPVTERPCPDCGPSLFSRDDECLRCTADEE